MGCWIRICNVLCRGPDLTQRGSDRIQINDCKIRGTNLIGLSRLQTSDQIWAVKMLMVMKSRTMAYLIIGLLIEISPDLTIIISNSTRLSLHLMGEQN